MRNFESFLIRRKIKDFRGWCSNSGIESFENFCAYCESQELSFDRKKYSVIFSEMVNEPKPEALKTDTTTKKAEVKEKTDEESWHVPAAERPIKSRRSTRKPPAKKTPPKTKAKPRARKAKKD